MKERTTRLRSRRELLRGVFAGMTGAGAAQGAVHAASPQAATRMLIATHATTRRASRGDDR